MISTQELIRLVRGPVAIAEPLAPYTGIRIGGTADFLVKPRDRSDMASAFGYFKALGFPFFILGRGRSLLVNDKGFRGAVIATHFLDRIAIDGEIVEADAGVSVPMLLARSQQASLGGMEQLESVSGTVGGALRRNAGIVGRRILDHAEWIDILRNGRVRRLKKKELTSSACPPMVENDVILGAAFRMKKLSPKEKMAARRAFDATGIERSSVTPQQEASTGSVFRIPRDASALHGSSAGELIDACGLRGKCIGGASISLSNANSIVNDGGATSGDVLDLARFARQEVSSRFGVTL
ncbi:MAG: UDP-N-acetylmuramate dehydrogenase, partial [Chlorobiaceae bacterium]|nr:UDP-N-acetylmuramate dehydrogenase [Chlorobiaceae bacterium]